MDDLKRKRRPLRAQLTKLINECDTELAKDAPNLNDLLLNRDLLQKVYQKLETCDQAVQEQLFADGASENEEDKEYEDVQRYEKNYLRIRKAIDEKCNARPRAASPTASEAGSYSTASGGNMQDSVKLPKMELQKFDGDLKAWLGFWASFQKIHNNQKIDAADKFHYLLQSMVHGSKAHQIVSSYPPTAENYQTVVSVLKERFGNNDTLLQVYVRELLQLVIKNVTSPEKIPLESLYTKLDSHLRALKTLELEKADPATWLFPLVESSLPDEILLSWQRSSLSSKDGSKEEPPRTRLDILLEFMKNEVKIEERIQLAKSGFSSEEVKGPKKGKDKKFEEKVPTLAGLHVADSSSSSSSGCVFCGKSHLSQECFKARKMTLEEKKKILVEKNACFRCLKIGHSAKKCKASVMCYFCEKPHHSVMCDSGKSQNQQQRQGQGQQQQPPQRREWNSGRNSNAVNSTNGNSQQSGPQQQNENLSGCSSVECSREVVLKTLMVNIVVDGRKRAARVFFDGGNQRSYIMTSTTAELGLKSHGEVNACHLLFKGKKTPVEKHRKFMLNLERLGGGFSYEMEARSTDVISANIPRVRKDANLFEELKQRHIYFNDIGSDSPPIEILIGADHETKLLTGRKVELNCGLVALETKLGWTLVGEWKESPRENIVGMMVMSMTAADASIQNMWSLETLGIQDDCEKKTVQQTETEAKAKFMKSIERSSEGRYSVPLPFIEDHPPVPINKEGAFKRLERSTTKLVQEGKFEDYDKFLRNRVREIRDKTKPENWRHVPGDMNPADLPSRGCSPCDLLASKWWEGPAWLKQSSDSWPPPWEDKVEEDNVENLSSASLFDGVRIDHSYCCSVRIMGWILRFIRRKQKECIHVIRGNKLTQEELQEAELVLLRKIQEEGLDMEDHGSLMLVKDEKGLLRVKTKLVHRKNLMTDFKMPILLPRKHPMVQKIIMETHVRECHAGKMVMSVLLRKRFWITKSRKTINQVLHKCFRCRRYAAKATVVEESPLPVDRVKNAEPFEVTGVDLAGPLILRGGNKAWIVIYTCAVYRAVFLDVVTSASTHAFVKSFGKFIGKHGRPAIVYSDNGKNFVGASNFFNEIDDESRGGAHPIQWKFNPPTAAWWGGWWERLIRTVKDLLRKTLGKASVKLHELQSVLGKVAEVMNQRPLTYVSEDPEVLEPLTPAMFLRTPSRVVYPEGELTESDALRIRHKHVNCLKDELRRRFLQEYLALLVCKRKKLTPPLEVGDIVFVGSDGQKRMEWKLGRVLELIAGKDGVHRVAKVKTDSGILCRPVQRLHPLEMDRDFGESLRRSERIVKAPERLGMEDK